MFQTLPTADVLPRALYGVLLLIALAAASCLLTRAYTTWNYYHCLRQFSNARRPSKALRPPQIPYTIPFLGNALQFLNSTPGKFWNDLFAWHPRSTGVCTLLVAGQRTHVLFSQAAVQALLKLRSTSRETFERNIMRRVFDFGPEDAHVFFTRSKEPLLKLTHQFLLRHDSASELLGTFMRFLPQGLDHTLLKLQAAEEEKYSTVGLCAWVREAVFNVSTKAIFGEELAKMYPKYYPDYYTFDAQFQKFFFGLPRFMNEEAYSARTRILDNLDRWGVAVRQATKDRSMASDDAPWDPVLGSRLVRARMISLDQLGHTTKATASLDLGLTSALVSNAIPATTWMLLHLLSPRRDSALLPKVLATIAEAEMPDGSLDNAALVSHPLLSSIWVEVLRLYTDVLLSRDLNEDLVLPLDYNGEKSVSLRKDDNILAPSWLAHRDRASWPSDSAPLDEFHPERFLSKESFTSSGSFSPRENDGKFFPFGGGKTHCPGRIFAKMEAIGAFAYILHRYEIAPRGFVDAGRHRTSSFPHATNALPGSMLLVPEGDMLVTVRPK